MSTQREPRRHPAMPVWFLGRPGSVYLPRYGRRIAADRPARHPSP
jgi:hypothetical protein